MIFTDEIFKRVVIFNFREICNKINITEKQDIKMLEELNEFSKEVLKCLGESSSISVENISDNLYEELADMLLTVYLFMLRHGIDEERLLNIMTAKLIRFKNKFVKENVE